MSYKDLIELGSEAAVRERGLMRIEGKDYEVKDGDILYYRFNV
jgi:ribosome-binding ATPase YchF (GTP1/OBG family)